jgi:hypothetical protein
MMAVVDARTGKVYPPPLSGAGSEMYVPMDMMGEAEIDFQLDSTLMVLRNACRKGRSECGVYYFGWKGDRFDLLRHHIAAAGQARTFAVQRPILGVVIQSFKSTETECLFRRLPVRRFRAIEKPAMARLQLAAHNPERG